MINHLLYPGCCTGVNTDGGIELSSPICQGSQIQPTRFSYVYKPNGNTNDGKNVYKADSSNDYIFYSTTIKVSIHTETFRNNKT